MVRVIRARVRIRVRVGVRVRVRVTIYRFAPVCLPFSRQKLLPLLTPRLSFRAPSVGGRKSVKTRAKQGQETVVGTISTGENPN